MSSYTSELAAIFERVTGEREVREEQTETYGRGAEEHDANRDVVRAVDDGLGDAISGGEAGRGPPTG
ncbi:hypothetical protein J2752_001759 [Halarchaeum rubridurum]|uniref:Uncharacterized protein n=1 Tax=Halarchaeum rubridurum TaxID=489911 RepID=A0A830FQ89_9EURY|nr:hypothetical protein [Halarchaeum rubridurum]MBP1954847.1 hypothetical protein [Halarchaeum rubridurum]GGM60216.1 hypothetical protein GCM10009017_07970 [Halarchaeum rubridurum]